MAEDDPVENIIGRFGKYQTWILILVLAGRYPTDFQLTNVVFILPKGNYICLDNNKTDYCPCGNPLYNTTDIVTSVTSEFNLICDRQSLASLSQSMLQIGILPGGLMFSYISDKYGRKIAVILSELTTVAFVVISAVVPKFWMFMVCRCLIGAGVGGTMLCSYVIIIEFSGRSFRPQTVGLYELSYITGYMIIPLIAYFVREWRYLQLVTSVPWLYIPIYIWLLPESPRWLITVGKKEQAIKVLTLVAKRNNRHTANIASIVESLTNAAAHRESQGRKRSSYIELFRTPIIRYYTIINALIWMFCAHTFFGINQYIGRLQGNIYLNVFISALSLLPMLIIVVLVAIYCSRRLSVMVSFILVGVSLLALIVIPSYARAIALACAIIGQCGAFATFVLMYLFSSEIFPTIVRNSAMGFASVFARLGSFLAPFVVNIGVQWISISIFSGLAFLAAVLCFFLPETKDTVLINTIEQLAQRREQPTIRSSVSVIP